MLAGAGTPAGAYARSSTPTRAPKARRPPVAIAGHGGGQGAERNGTDVNDVVAALREAGSATGPARPPPQPCSGAGVRPHWGQASGEHRKVSVDSLPDQKSAWQGGLLGLSCGSARIRASKCSLRSNGRPRSIRRLATRSLRSQCGGGIVACGCWRKFVDVDVSGDGGGYAIRRSLDRTGQPIVGT